MTGLKGDVSAEPPPPPPPSAASKASVSRGLSRIDSSCRALPLLIVTTVMLSHPHLASTPAASSERQISQRTLRARHDAPMKAHGGRPIKGAFLILKLIFGFSFFKTGQRGKKYSLPWLLRKSLFFMCPLLTEVL